MQKIKTPFFWKVLLGHAALFIVIRLCIDLIVEDPFFEIRRIAGIVVTGMLMGIFMAFYTKQKPKRITDFNEVK